MSQAPSHPNSGLLRERSGDAITEESGAAEDQDRPDGRGGCRIAPARNHRAKILTHSRNRPEKFGPSERKSA